MTCSWGASMVLGPAVSGKRSMLTSSSYSSIVLCAGVIADPVGQYDLPSSKYIILCVANTHMYYVRIVCVIH